MSTYLGVVLNQNDFYNFEPRYEIINGELKEYRNSDLDKLLVDSVKKNVNFSYDPRTDSDFFYELFWDKSLIVFELNEDDLEYNKTRDGDINQTMYKVPAKKLWNEGRIRPIDSEGFYYVITPEEPYNYGATGDIIELNDEIAVEDRVALIQIKEKGFLAGPYEIKYRNVDRQLYVNTNAKKNKYTISGYPVQQLNKYTIDAGYATYNDSIRSFTIAKIYPDDEVEYVDIIDDETLLESFKLEVVQGKTKDGKIDFSDIKALIDEYEASMFKGKAINEKIRKDRLQRIVECFSAEESVDDTFTYIADTLGDTLYDIIEKYKESGGIERFIDELLRERPELLNKMGGTKPVQERIERLQQQEEKLINELNELKNLKEDSKAAIEKTAKDISEEFNEVELKKGEMLKELEELQQQIGAYKAHIDLETENLKLKEDIEYREKRHRELQDGTKQLEASFTNKLNEYNKQMYDITFDGFMSNKMLEASARWEDENSQVEFSEALEQLNNVPVSDKTPDELIDYLCNVIHTVRPSYDRNTIINLAICFTQGFLTVLSGKPGCGKTSICNIFAQALGLNKIREFANENTAIDLARYIPVSVERGWTSKRDFIGYFNPLTKAFDKNNRQMFDALKLLHLEEQEGIFRMPFMVLLDEANLSPMEYYWADFMNVCDDSGHGSSVNLGGDNVFKIPETIHFFATINNDHTTEVLSPRLIDRAWIVTLPKSKPEGTLLEIPEDMIEIISWKSMKNAFAVDDTKIENISPMVKQMFEKVSHLFEKRQLNISPRTELAVKNYCGVAAELFENKTTGVDGSIIALDYAICQKILPKISGYGDEFASWLEEFRQFCTSNALYESANIIRGILARGEEQMKYYQFFG